VTGTSIRGCLPEVGLVPLLRSLGGLDRAGRLELEYGEVFFDRGRIVAAVAGDEQGLSALARLCREPARGAFVYEEDGWPIEPQPELRALEATEVLAALELLGAAPSLSAIARPRPAADTQSDSGEGVDLERAALAILVESRDGKTVAQLIARHGLMRSLRALTALRELDLIDFALPAPGQEAPAPWRRAPHRLTLPPVSVRVLAVVAGVSLLARGVVQTFHIEGSSMEPNFTSGQRLAVERLAYVGGGPQRGEVVVFHSPTAPDEDFIKRVIGLPGDSVLIRNGRVFVNGQAVDEPYVRFPADYSYPADGQPATVPPDSYFVLGDNRPASFDSHAGWVVRSDELVGRAALSIWPPATWGPIQIPQASA
jgi:signal peptidase I